MDKKATKETISKDSTAGKMIHALHTNDAVTLAELDRKDQAASASNHTMIDVVTIMPNPYQPEERLHPPIDVVTRFAISIRQHGLIQVPLGRLVNRKVQIGDGWLRVCAYRKLLEDGVPGFDSIPVDLKPITDQQMADMVLEANTVRQDLSPIAEARLYKRYIEEFGQTQEQLAQAHNLTQGEVANRIRLLELPEYIQRAVIFQEIPPTAARHLLRLNHDPKSQENFYDGFLKNPTSISQLSNEIAYHLYNESKSLDTGSGYSAPIFNLTECQKCESNQPIGSPYSKEKAKARCCRPECWEKKREAELEEIKKKRLAEIQALAKAEVTSKDKKLVAAEKVGELKVVSRDKLNYNEYAELTEWGIKELDNPGECQTCTRRVLRQSYNNKDFETLCIDLKCHRAKKMKRTKDTNKIAREAHERETANLKAIALHMGMKNTPNVLMALLELIIEDKTGDPRNEIAAMCGLTLDKKGSLHMATLRADLRAKKVEELVQIGAAAVLAYTRWDKMRLRKAIAVLQGIGEDFDKVQLAWRETNCRDCIHANQECLDITKKPCWDQQLDDLGNCTARSVKEPAAAGTK